MLENSYWLRSGFYTLSEKFSALVFGFGGALMLFRSLTKESFGVWVLFLSVTSILEVGRIGLLQNALVKYLTTGDEQEAGKITTASLVLNVLLSLVMVILLQVFAGAASLWFDAPQLADLLRIYSLTTLLLVPFFQFNYVQQANLDFRGIFWSNFAKGGILFSYILILFVANKEIDIKHLAVCQVVAAVACSFVSWFFTKDYLRFSSTIDWHWVSKLFHFGKFVFGTNLSTQLFKNVDKLLLGGLPAGGAAAVALYDAAIRVTNLTDVPTASMANILYPLSARCYQEGNGVIKELYEKAVSAVLAFMLPCIAGVMFFAEWIIWVVAGPGYEQAASLLRITILFGLFMPYAVQFGTVMDSIGKPRMNFLFTIGSLVLTGVLNIFFISRWGALGAATGTLIAYGLTFLATQIYLARLLKVNPLNVLVQSVGYYQKIWQWAKGQWNQKKVARTTPDKLDQ